MKFKHINIHNLSDLLPTWAINTIPLARKLDDLFDTTEGLTLVPKGDAIYAPLAFWIEVDASQANPYIRICTPDDVVNLNGRLIVTCGSNTHSNVQLDLPLNPIFKGYDRISGHYCIYMHSFQTEVPLGYVGMTKQRWFERYSQHLSSSRNGSPYLFHRALREHPSAAVLHKVFYCELSHDYALQYEEELVQMFCLYPLGLNMIPGGKAGFAYLGQLGMKARNAEERDALVEAISARSSIEGRPNPLCAARWATDSDFAERVICGHSGRLTVEQVKAIHMHSSSNHSIARIMSNVGARNARQVKNVLEGKTYSRVRKDA